MALTFSTAPTAKRVKRATDDMREEESIQSGVQAAGRRIVPVVQGVQAQQAPQSAAFAGSYDASRGGYEPMDSQVAAMKDFRASMAAQMPPAQQAQQAPQAAPPMAQQVQTKPDFSPGSPQEMDAAQQSLKTNPHMPTAQAARARTSMDPRTRGIQQDIDDMTQRGAQVATQQPNALAGTGGSYGPSAYEPFNQNIYDAVRAQNIAAEKAKQDAMFNPYQMDPLAAKAKMIGADAMGGRRVETDPRAVTAYANEQAAHAEQQAAGGRDLPGAFDAYGNPIKQNAAISRMNQNYSSDRLAQEDFRAARGDHAANQAMARRIAQTSRDPQLAASAMGSLQGGVAARPVRPSTGFTGAVRGLQAESGTQRGFDVQERAADAKAYASTSAERAAEIKGKYAKEAAGINAGAKLPAGTTLRAKVLENRIAGGTKRIADLEDKINRHSTSPQAIEGNKAIQAQIDALMKDMQSAQDEMDGLTKPKDAPASDGPTATSADGKTKIYFRNGRWESADGKPVE